LNIVSPSDGVMLFTVQIWLEYINDI